MFLKTNPWLYAGMHYVIQRKTAEIYEETKHGIFLKDTVSQFCMMAVDSPALGEQWLIQHEKTPYAGLCVFHSELAYFAQQRYSFSTRLNCFQAVYPLAAPPVFPAQLQIRAAEAQDLQSIAEHYHHVSESELAEDIRLGNLFLGYFGQTMVGFVGQHPEGAIGLLHVLPEHRRCGYAKELESFMISRMLAEKQLPFCQVEEENLPSLRLQEQIGMKLADGKVYFVY